MVELKLDGSDVADVLADLSQRPEEVARLGVRNAIGALRRHDWAHRWGSILDAAGLPARPALSERMRTLDALAANADGISLLHNHPPFWPSLLQGRREGFSRLDDVKVGC